MTVDSKTTKALKEGEYLLSDPAILENMRLSCDLRAPGSLVTLVTQYTLITPALVEKLLRRNVETLFAEPLEEKTVVASVEHLEKMFGVLDDVLTDATAGTVDEIALSFQNRQNRDELERLIKENIKDIDPLFKNNPTEKLIALTQHHNSTARHSIIAAFHLMAIGRALGWRDTKIVEAAFAAFNHDIGKTKIKLETLNWPGRLNKDQWKEIQQHTLFGSRLLFQRGKEPDLAMLTALLHHEWYVSVEGKGYGGLTLFSDFIKRAWGVDIPQIIKATDPSDLEIIHATALADMVSALEESRAYKRGLDAFKVLIIMNTDARMGHFNPEHYAAWHRIYRQQNPTLLPRGRRMALPREKERRVFEPQTPKSISPTPFLTYYEMEQLGFLTVLRNTGMDMERIQRRGGLSLKVLAAISEEKNLNLDYSSGTLESHGITLIKSQLIQEEQIIELDAWHEWLTVEELEKTGMLYRLKAQSFDLGAIREKGGISPKRMRKRGLSVPKDKLERLDIPLLKKISVRLPGSENRITAENLKKLGITDQRLKEAGCLDRVKKIKSGVPLAWLVERGIPLSHALLARHGIDPVRKVFYDICVVEEISPTKAKFLILREGDDPQELDTMCAQNTLEPIQSLLLHEVGEVVMDFSDLIALPDLSRVVMGSHWMKGG